MAPTRSACDLVHLARKGAVFFCLMLIIMGGLTRPLYALGSTTAPAHPLTLYGPLLSFDIYRNGTRIGEHNVRFTDTDGTLRVRTDFNLSIGALFITLYELTYSSDAIWRDGVLRGLTASTNRNGDLSTVSAQENGDGQLNVSGPNGTQVATIGLYPTNHWNAGVISSSELLNTITGKTNNVTLQAVGTETVITNLGRLVATRYRYVGEIENEVWYDGEGRWVRMQFPGDDGSLIELRCRQCVRPSQAIADREVNP